MRVSLNGAPAPGLMKAAPLAIDFEQVWVRYGGRVALRRVTFTAAAGLRIGVVGPNGSGKSTLLQACVGMVPPSEGRVLVQGLPPAAARRQAAYVPQRERIRWDFPVSVFDVALMGRYGQLGWLRRPGAADRALALAALERMEMAHLRNAQISELSGGQQQRVFLARALAQQAQLILLDEPLNGLDAPTYAALLAALEDEQRRGATIIMATHDLATARSWCDLALLLNTDLIAAGPPAAVFTPERLRRTYGSGVLALGGEAPLLVEDDRHDH